MIHSSASNGGVAAYLKSGFSIFVSAFLVFGLAMAHAPAPAQAKNNGLGAAAVGLAAGLVIGGALSNAAKSQPKRRPPQKKKKPSYSKKKTYKKKKYSKPKSRSAPKKKYTKRKSNRKQTVRRSAPVNNVQSEVYQVKSALASLGHLSGDINDNRDRSYDQAIKSYQRAKRVAATGVLDNTQRQLLVREAEGRNMLIAMGSPNARVSTLESNKRIQRALQVLGYYKSGIDGKIGSGSRRAIASYQSNRGLPTTGDVSSPKAKADLISTARKSVETDVAAINAQFAQISRQQFASLNGGAVAPAKPAASQAVASTPAAPRIATGVSAAAPAVLPGGHLPTATKTALPSTASNFAAIEPVRADAKILRPNDVAVIIGNRNYKGDIPVVAFGHRDADAMKSVLVNDLGFSRSNVIDARDAGQAELVSIFGSKTNNRGKVWRLIDPDGKSNVFVFYSGHGAPDTQSNTPYLMPVDSHPDTIQLNGYPLSQMYSNLEGLDVKSAVVFLDACFSGGSAGGMLTQAASPVAVTAKMPAIKTSQKLTVLAAAEGDQLASWDEKSGFGMFTNSLVSGLKGNADKNNDKQITASELHSYVHNKVRRSARREFGRIQTPVLMGQADYVVRVKQ
ncbi:MAG: peptidoglycan-binding protein [Pseudomonadota bacterium]